MQLTISSDEDLESIAELIRDAEFREGVFHLVEGAMVLTCEVLRAVPDKAEEYWMGPTHRTRIPWTRCLLEFTGISRVQVRPAQEQPAVEEGASLLAWETQGASYNIRLRTNDRLELWLTLPHLAGRCQDVGSLIWQR